MCNKPRITLTIDKDILTNLKIAAEQNNRSISQQVCFELKHHKNFIENGGKTR